MSANKGDFVIQIAQNHPGDSLAKTPNMRNFIITLTKVSANLPKK